MTDQRARLTKSKATASTTALQTLEITTTAVVADPPLEESRKQLSHRHYHYVRSPAFHADISPLPSPQILENSELPPPMKCTSEAVVALQDAVNESNTTKKTSAPTTEFEIFQSSFFSSILLIQWSNVVGPKVDKVWSAEAMDEGTQMMIARQVLNGEMGTRSVESKWILLPSMMCTAFLFEDPTLHTLFAIVLVVPARVITSHLQTFGSTVLIGNSLGSVNMMINTLSLLLSLKERNRSSHARKHHRYMPDLYLQGLLVKDIEEMEPRIELAVLDSIVPTTLVDMTRLVVKRTPLYNQYQQLRQSYQAAVFSKLENDVLQRHSKLQMNDWSKRSQVFEKVNSIAPMVQSLLEEVRRIPTRLRESYIKQWKRSLVKRALALIKYIEDETLAILGQVKVKENFVKNVMNALSLYDLDDFTIVLTQAEKLKPGMINFITSFSRTDTL
ncbi:hypothetical protein G6F46_004173 [Rhizopus delemar]|uniref:Uncharacterized protein n=2 Tax=Rhizopus TaxID=4842 RepID=A0A9P6ZCD2_9FUNG|nr:hypothetical protein G6F43_002431 [Rhizopus delemar]KAG1551678.1 hypothetical protein G6F51_001689 [Rhizopus arrhizus]KAG1454979.1 hypothetical protein G6F55_007324 [Rhizopus delemar]KAG1499555.1 hypothetical protein G6F54_004327 [Rhizopus delemar]KAG1513324.1 hypothetical protein G6F53_004514 [Rhizopus delemar]